MWFWCKQWFGNVHCKFGVWKLDTWKSSGSSWICSIEIVFNGYTRVPKSGFGSKFNTRKQRILVQHIIAPTDGFPRTASCLGCQARVRAPQKWVDYGWLRQSRFPTKNGQHHISGILGQLLKTLFFRKQLQRGGSEADAFAMFVLTTIRSTPKCLGDCACPCPTNPLKPRGNATHQLGMSPK